jgi:hypothetical protein
MLDAMLRASLRTAVFSSRLISPARAASVSEVSTTTLNPLLSDGILLGLPFMLIFAIYDFSINSKLK